jgi:hypothetical protein
MIQDLKADSARWEQERRAASRSSGNGGGTTHSSQTDGVFVRRSSNSPLGSRDQPRGQDYNSWKITMREQQQYQAENYGSAMDIDYAPAPAAAAPTQVYPGQQYQAAPAANYPPATYAPPAAHYQAQAGYGYAPNPPPAQYSPQPQSGDRYAAIPPQPISASYGQDPGPFVTGANYQTGQFPPPAANRMPPAMPHVSAAPPRSYNAPTTAAYGAEPDYGYSTQPGIPVSQSYTVDPVYGRGAYTATLAQPTEASSNELGSPAGAPQQAAFASPPVPQYDDAQKAGLQPTASPTAAAPAQLPTPSAPPARREREPDPRDRERDYRDHKSRRSEPEDRHPDRSRHHRR